MIFQGKRGSGELQQGRCQEHSEPSPSSWRAGSQAQLAPRSLSWACSESQCGSTWLAAFNKAHVKTHSRRLSCLRLSFVMYTNIFPNQMLVHN